MEDKRFSHIAKDPKFRRIPKGQSKIKIDKRFQSMFTDKKFQVKYSTDKRGRPIKHHSKEDLKRYYELNSEEESEDEPESLATGKFVRAPKTNESSEEESSEEEPEEKEGTINKLEVKHKCDKRLPDIVKEKLLNLSVDYARGEGALLSDSSSDDEETDDEISESEEIDHRWGELDADAGKTEEATYRLAACNLDWDRIRALDLMVLFNSFLPPGGVIKSVVIYPSEFGKQRMKEEETKGPIELVDAKKDVQSDEENEEGSTYHMEKLRQYQLNRLKYYYAVISFDCPASANKIYTECDGMEYESSATKIDLRFVPDDMTFDDVPKDSCDKLPDKYEPRFFTTTALQQAKVNCTWDETNPDRLEFAEKMNSGKIDDISENDLQNFLAASSEEEEDEGESEGENESDDDEGSQAGNAIDKYKALLADIQEKEEEKKNKDIGMEISWGIDLKEKTDKLIKEKQNNQQEKTPFEKYLDKRKEKRKEKRELKKKSKNDEETNEDSDLPSDVDMSDPYFAEEFNNPEFKKSNNNKKKNKNKKVEQNEEDAEEDKEKQAELDLLLMNDDDGKKHFSLKKILEKEEKGKKKKKRKNKKEAEEEIEPEDEFKVNVADKRFSAIFTSHHYNIDPTDPHYKKTKGMETLIQEKIKRRTENDEVDVAEAKKPKSEQNQTKKKDVELSMLVKNVKRKAQAFKKK
ncbi:ESF1 homolog [Anthonomus grandis grandis]|uniref:ESF1 homolog n=1 Tax=Anthonomus grandis grandis TaxID=2921223 RepID=UPI002165EBE0|nr:ESF1 homolog [Anthonomus grandis grandis]